MEQKFLKNLKAQEPQTETIYHGQNRWKKKKKEVGILRQDQMCTRAHSTPRIQVRILVITKSIKCLKTTPGDTKSHYLYNKGLKVATGTYLSPPHRFQQDEKIVVEPTLDEVVPKTPPHPRFPLTEMLIKEEPTSEKILTMTETGIAHGIKDI